MNEMDDNSGIESVPKRLRWTIHVLTPVTMFALSLATCLVIWLVMSSGHIGRDEDSYALAALVLVSCIGMAVACSRWEVKLTGTCRQHYGVVVALALLLAISSAVLLGILSSYVSHQQHSRPRIAAHQAVSLTTALKLYRNECLRWPVPEGTPEGLLDSAHVIAVLTSGEETNAFTEEYNPRGRSFIELPPDCEEYVDPWGTPYHIIIDLDGNGIIDVGGTDIEKIVAVWSCGKNRKNDWGTVDDIARWCL